MDSTDEPRRVLRSRSDRWIAGVSGGLAEHLGVPSWVVRLSFLVTAMIGGLGVAAYALMWVFLPLDAVVDGQQGGRSRAAGGLDLTGVLGILSLALGSLLALSALGLQIRVSLWGPVLIVAAGVIVLWRQGDELREVPDRARTGFGVQATAGLTDRQGWIRVMVGLSLVLVGLIAVVGPRLDLATTGWAIAAVGAVLSGVVLIALPWLATWLRGLEAQRFAAVRAEERAVMAARVHDSVLQTLTLIQRRSQDPAEVARLARAEERALRSWLYAPPGSAGSLAAALAEMVATTEADYDVRIELVAVGDVQVDERMTALVAATREAVVNSAKHAGALCSVYAEVADEQVEVDVRDRGRGFDPDSVSADRHGIRESIVARMASVGGSSSVRGEPGTGTEVRLVLPLEVDGDD